MKGWLFLVIAIVGEVIATSALKSSEGFTKLAPSAVVIIGYGIAFYFLSLVLKSIQSRIESAIESFVNIAIGYFVAIISQMVVFPIFDIHVSMQTNLLIGAWFTCISLVRSYVVRRLFNMRTRNKSMPAPAATSERRRQAAGNTARGRRPSTG